MSKRLASIAEEFVAYRLICRGYQIIARNARHIGFELDIIAWKKPEIAIVEVKLRRQPLASLDGWESLLSKNKRLALLRGSHWVVNHCEHLPVVSIRFDLAMVVYDQNKDVLSMDYREDIDLFTNA